MLWAWVGDSVKVRSVYHLYHMYIASVSNKISHASSHNINVLLSCVWIRCLHTLIRVPRIEIHLTSLLSKLTNRS